MKVPRWFIWVGVVLIVIAIARVVHIALTPQPAPTPLRTDTASAESWRQVTLALGKMYAGQRGLATRLREQLEGVKKLRPGVRTVYDTLTDSISYPVFVHVGITNDRDVVLHYLVPDSGGFRPVRDSAISLPNCDERLDFYNGEIRCDPARLGHFGLFAGAEASSSLSRWPPIWARDSLGLEAQLGLQWRPSYRSASGAQLYISQTRRLTVHGWKGVWF